MAEAPFSADQRIADVTRHFEYGIEHARIELRDVDPCEVCQRSAARRQWRVLRIEQPHAQRLQHAGAAVIGGAAAHAQDEAARARVERGEDQVARATAGRVQRVALRRRDQFQAAGGRHFDHGDDVAARQAVEGVDGCAQRTGRAQVDAAAGRCGDHRLDGAFAAIGDGDLDVAGVRENLAETRLDGAGCFQRRQAFLE